MATKPEVKPVVEPVVESQAAVESALMTLVKKAHCLYSSNAFSSLEQGEFFAEALKGEEA